MEPLQYNDIRTLECLIEVDPKSTSNPDNPLRMGQRVRVELEDVAAPAKVPQTADAAPARGVSGP